MSDEPHAYAAILALLDRVLKLEARVTKLERALARIEAKPPKPVRRLTAIPPEVKL